MVLRKYKPKSFRWTRRNVREVVIGGVCTRVPLAPNNSISFFAVRGKGVYLRLLVAYVVGSFERQ